MTGRPPSARAIIRDTVWESSGTVSDCSESLPLDDVDLGQGWNIAPGDISGHLETITFNLNYFDVDIARAGMWYTAMHGPRRHIVEVLPGVAGKRLDF